MSSLLRCGGMVRLLAVLWVMARCGASQQQPSAVLNITPDELWRFIEQAVKSEIQQAVKVEIQQAVKVEIQQAVKTEIQPLINKLESRIDILDSRLYALDSRLDSRMDALDTRVDALTVRLYSHGFQPDGLATKVDSQATKLESQQSQLDSQATKLESQQSQLDSQATKLDSQQSQLEGLATKVDNQDSRLDGLSTKTDSQQTQIDEMTTKLDRGKTEPSTPAPQRHDCSDLPAGAQSGVHLLQPGLGRPVPVVPAYCDLDTDGGNWTVIQRRAYVQPRQNFYLGWQAYKEGFGELDAEFWWGLEHLWAMTSSRDRRYELHINMEDFDGEKRHAVYQGFRISPEGDGYRLAAANYTGDAGDGLKKHVGQRFSTKDKDQDTWSGKSCAQYHKAAWWYGACYDANLNGQPGVGHTPGKSVVSWKPWRGWDYSLKTVEMKIRPTNKFREV